MFHRLLRRAMPLPPPQSPLPAPRMPGVTGGRLFASLPSPPPLQSRRYLTTHTLPFVRTFPDSVIVWHCNGTCSGAGRRFVQGRHGSGWIGRDVSWGSWGSGFRHSTLVEVGTGAAVHRVGKIVMGSETDHCHTPFSILVWFPPALWTSQTAQLGWADHLMVQCCHSWILILFLAPRIRVGFAELSLLAFASASSLASAFCCQDECECFAS